MRAGEQGLEARRLTPDHREVVRAILGKQYPFASCLADMQVRAVGRHEGGAPGEHADPIVGMEVPRDRDDLAEQARMLQGDVHRTVAAHREPRDGAMVSVAPVTALHRGDDRADKPGFHLVGPIRRVGPFGVPMVLTVAIRAGDDDRWITIPQALIKYLGEPVPERVSRATGVSVQEVQHRDPRGVRTGRAPDPHVVRLAIGGSADGDVPHDAAAVGGEGPDIRLGERRDARRDNQKQGEHREDGNPLGPP